jgi:hypothetical protein
MFWTFLLATSLAAALIELGAASAKVSFMAIGLQATAIVIALLAILLLWKSFSKKNEALLLT